MLKLRVFVFVIELSRTFYAFVIYSLFVDMTVLFHYGCGSSKWDFRFASLPLKFISTCYEKKGM